MDTEITDDLIDFVKQVDPNAEIEDLTVRSIDAIKEFLIFVSTTGFFSGLWTLYQTWHSHRHVATIQIEYFTEDQTRVQIDYKDKTQQYVDNFIKMHPPKKGGAAKVSIRSDKQIRKADTN